MSTFRFRGFQIIVILFGIFLMACASLNPTMAEWRAHHSLGPSSDLVSLNEKREGIAIAEMLQTPLNAQGDSNMAARFLKGGFGQDGYGVAEGSAIDGSHAFEGDQGYYVKDAKGNEIGKKVFLDTVNSMKEFFQSRRKIRYVIKPGIGGQYTPFQAIAGPFEVMDIQTGKIVGEYELGKNFETTMSQILSQYRADRDQIAIIPSSKSGSTDETMMIFVELLAIQLKHIASQQGIDGKRIDGEKFAKLVLDTLHEVNFPDGSERSGKDLFKGFSLSFVQQKANEARLDVTLEQVKTIFGKILGNMFFETTDRPAESRLSAFIRNSGLGQELGANAPGFGAMFDNVGGRWSGDLHMMTFLAYYNLDAEAYWERRVAGIREVRAGVHIGNQLGNRILDEGITDIALVIPDHAYWFGKAMEQNFNESIWQEGFANLIAIKEKHWKAQKVHYANNPNRLVINLSGLQIPGDSFKVVELNQPSFRQPSDKQQLAETIGELFTTFYGMTSTVGNRLIARALKKAGYMVKHVDLNNLDHPATKIVQQNLYFRQPYVELGKGLLEGRLKALQEREARKPGAIEQALQKSKRLARKGELRTNISDIEVPGNVRTVEDLTKAIKQAMRLAQRENRKFVPFIYLEGEKFYQLRDYLTKLGIEWVMQGTCDQHISYQQVLAQPKRYLPFIISMIPQQTLPGRPAIGFAKGYLHNVSPHLVRDYFAEASYRALTERRKRQGGLGLFLRLIDSEENRRWLKEAAGSAVLAPTDPSIEQAV